MFKKINLANTDRYAKHLVVVSLVVFLLVINLFIFDYASATSGSDIDTNVNSGINYVAATYDRSADYMYDYSVAWGELLLGWEDFIVDTYYLSTG